MKLAIKSGGGKLKLRLARIKKESEMGHKHPEKRKLKKEIAALSNQLKESEVLSQLLKSTSADYGNISIS